MLRKQWTVYWQISGRLNFKLDRKSATDEAGNRENLNEFESSIFQSLPLLSIK